jgi:hypothetical protein
MRVITCCAYAFVVIINSTEFEREGTVSLRGCLICWQTNNIIVLWCRKWSPWLQAMILFHSPACATSAKMLKCLASSITAAAAPTAFMTTVGEAPAVTHAAG